jgi:penicillin-insensitive murein endopeptidase
MLRTALSCGALLAFAAVCAAPAPALAKTHHDRTATAVHHVKASKHATKRKKGKKAAPVQDARKLFAAKALPSAQTPNSFGRYDNGCVAGAEALPVDGQNWQVMRLSRNRNWGRKPLVTYIENYADRAHKAGWNGLLIGDMSMPRGGPMPSGHASHQIGLDVDVWLRPAPDQPLSAAERETWEAYSVLKVDTADLDMNVWTNEHAAMVKEAAQDADVARIFVTPAIKKYWCDRKDPRGADTEWLRRLRPWEGHDDHIHVRLHCPKADGSCGEQSAPPPGDGCGQELTEWMQKVAADPPYTSTPQQPSGPKKPFPLTSMPNSCRAVLNSKP